MNTIYNLPALETLASLPDGSIDLLCSDIPYGLNQPGRAQVALPSECLTIREDWDKSCPVDFMEACLPKLSEHAAVIIFAGQRSIFDVYQESQRLGWKYLADITWVKPDAPPNMTGRFPTQSTERFLWLSPSGSKWTYDLQVAKQMGGNKNLTDVWRFPIERHNRIHPSQKPLALMERIIRLFSKPNDLVCDPYCGSGTTLVAARNNGRRYVGGDLSVEYIAGAQSRLDQGFTPSFLLQEDITDAFASNR